MEIAEKGGYINKPKVGWYEAIDPATGEVLSEKLLRAKEIVDNSDFWDMIFNKTDFASYVKNAFSVGCNIIIPDEDNNEVLEEVVEKNDLE